MAVFLTELIGTLVILAGVVFLAWQLGHVLAAIRR